MINIGQAFADIFDGKAEQDVLDFIEGEFTAIEKAVTSNPAVSAAVTSLKTSAETAASDLASWAGTAADSALSDLTAAAQSAIGPALVKYAAAVGIPTTGPLGVAEAVLVQAAVSAVQAAAHAAVVSVLPAPAAPNSSS